MTISDRLRKAIREYGTLYRVAKDSGVAWQVLRRFLDGERDIRLATAEKLADLFGLELAEAKPAKRATPKRPGRKTAATKPRGKRGK